LWNGKLVAILWYNEILFKFVCILVTDHDYGWPHMYFTNLKHKQNSLKIFSTINTQTLYNITFTDIIIHIFACHIYINNNILIIFTYKTFIRLSTSNHHIFRTFYFQDSTPIVIYSLKNSLFKNFFFKILIFFFKKLLL